jgi:hypothetical protein
LTGLESRRAGAAYPDQPAQDVISGPTRDASGEFVYEVNPKMTTSYRLMVLGSFGDFATIEVAPKLELDLLRRTSDSRTTVRVRARGSTSLVGARISLERQTASGWEPATSLRLGANLQAVKAIQVRGSTRVRATLPATAHHAASTSSSVLVRGGS